MADEIERAARVENALTHGRFGWGEGPWNAEPDREEFMHAGLPCLVVRHWNEKPGPEQGQGKGSLNGYVFVPEGHPAFGKRDLDPDPSVHGGLTWRSTPEAPINHAACVGSWWVLGFDTGHAGDFQPGLVFLMRKHSDNAAPLSAFDGGTYREFAFVKHEVMHLAQQLAAMK